MSLSYSDLLAQTRASIRELSFDELKARLDAKEDFVLLDVREKEEFRAGYVPGAVNIPRGFLEMQIEGKIHDRSTKIVTMCAGGVRSALSAVTLAGLGTVIDAELSHHNVFFAADPAAEFGALFDDRAVPADPTLYLCAQDRPPRSQVPPIGSPERMLALINAPALPEGVSPPCPPQPTDVPRAARSRSSSSWTSMPSTLDACETWMRRRLAGAGVEMDPKATTLRRGPADWASLYPGTGGSLYGQASHGWRQAFLRPGARTRLPGLYLAGGSVHPGAGLPMAASSGARAAEALWVDLHSTRGSRPAAMPGGMSTPSPTTAAMR